MGVSGVDVHRLPGQAGYITDVLAHGVQHFLHNAAVVYTDKNCLTFAAGNCQSVDFQFVQDPVSLTGDKVACYADA